MFSYLKGAIGIIQSIDPINYTASVKLPEYENQITENLQILTSLSYMNKVSCIPKVNTPVLVVFVGDNAENGFILGSYFSEINNCNEKENEYKINFQNSVLTIKESGNIDIDATLTTINSEVIVNGKTTINGDTSISKALNVTGKTSSEAGFSTKNISIENGTLNAKTGNIDSINYKEMKQS